MRQLCTAFVISCSLLYRNSALAEHQIDLRGIVNVPGHQVAFLQIDKETWAGSAGDRFKGGTKGSSYQIDVLEVDLTNEVVKTRIDGEDYTNSLPIPNRPAAAKSWIHLQDIDFQKAMELDGVLSGRTILLHPDVVGTQFSCEDSWVNEVPAKNEIIACFAKSLSQRQAASLVDGDCFLQVIPASMAQTAAFGSKDLSVETVTSGNINFRNVDIGQVIDIYAKLLGRQRKGGNFLNKRGVRINFQSTCALSKAQVIYAFEILFRWNGVNIVLNDDNTFSVSEVAGK
jgi:hypothetical protein